MIAPGQLVSESYRNRARQVVENIERVLPTVPDYAAEQAAREKATARQDAWLLTRAIGGSSVKPAETGKEPLPTWPIPDAYFSYKHLPPKLQGVGECFYNFAKWMVDALPDNADRTDALIKLHAAKDAAMWAAAS